MAKQDVTVELHYSGQWNDHTSDTLVRDEIEITRGGTDEQQQPGPGTCELTFSSWRFNPHNPTSDLHGLIGRNTPLRVYLGTAHVGESNVDTVDTTSHVAPSVDSPTDDALLLCAWAAPQPAQTYTVPGSMTGGSTFDDSRSTMKAAQEAISSTGATGTRTATFGASEDYVAASVLLHGTSPTVEEAELDNNGVLNPNSGTQAGWWVVVFSYWAWDGDASIPDFPVTDEGGWLLLADTGTINVADVDADNIRMKAWAKRWKTGGARDIDIGGPTDSLSYMYIVSGVGEWDVRFSGEVASWTPRQSLGGDNIPPDRWVEVVAADITRRLGQGQDPLRSALRRWIPTTDPVAYWPLDEGRFADLGRPLVGRHPWRPFSGSTKFGQDELAPWLGPGAAIVEQAGTMLGDVRMVTDPQQWSVAVMRRADDSEGPMVLTLRGNTEDGGTDWIVTFTPPDTIEVQLNEDGSFVDSDSTTDTSLFDGELHHLLFATAQTLSSTIEWRVYVDGTLVFTDTFTDAGLSLTGVGRVELSYTPGSPAGPLTFGHIYVHEPANLPTGEVEAAAGHAGEHAGRRIERLCDEEGVSFTSEGDLDDTVPLGPQHLDGLVAILAEAAAADLGTLLGARTSNAVHYRTGRSRYNQSATLALDYDADQVAPPLEPVVDDQQTRNDVTAQQRDGGEQRATDESGPLGVDTIGRYDTSVTVGTMSDGHDLAAQAGWRLHLGTVAGTRFPRITVDLDATPALADDASDVDAGDLLTVDNLPAELTPDLARLLVLGYVEAIGSHRRRITCRCAPEEPYHIAEVEGDDYGVVGSSSATLDEALDDSETGVDIDCGAGPEWVHESDYDVVIGGERMTVTAVSAATGTFPARKQTLTVTRSVNGVTKSHSSGARVRLFHQAYIGL